VTQRLSYKDNAIKHKKGVPYLADCNVPGVKCGTATDPLFPLKDLWEHKLILSIEALVAPGGPCHGAQVIFQEDNAGPHTKSIYHEWLNEQFAARQWHVELQAPQGIV
jgi:hypothetical protein